MASDQGDPIAELFAREAPALVCALRTADAKRAAGGGRFRQAIEADLKSAVHEVMGPRARTFGLELQPRERAIFPELWPRVGNVDVEIRARADRTWTGFMELKWARTDKLWHCVWDLAKAALVTHAGIANRALLLIGATARERATRYGAVLEAREWPTRAFLSQYADAMRPFCFAEEGREHPTGPYALPESFVVRPIGHIGCFKLRDDEWTVTLLDVTTRKDIGLVELDDRCVPLA